MLNEAARREIICEWLHICLTHNSPPSPIPNVWGTRVLNSYSEQAEIRKRGEESVDNQKIVERECGLCECFQSNECVRGKMY